MHQQENLQYRLLNETRKFAKYTGIKCCVLIYGGQGMGIQLDSAQKCDPEIVVATPGRLIDHLKEGFN